MYRFTVAEGVNPNDYVSSGISAGQDAILAQQIISRNSPDYGKLSLRGTAQKATNEVNRAAVELEREKSKRDLAKSDFAQKALSARNQQLKDERNNQRFAGKLALLAELKEEGFGEQRKRTEPYQPDYSITEELIKGLYDPALRRNQEQQDAIRDEIRKLGDNPMMNPSSQKTGEQSIYPVQGQDSSPVQGQNSSSVKQVSYAPTAYSTLQMSPEERALKDTIAFAEGTYKPDGGYNIRFGGERFDGFDKHPELSQAFLLAGKKNRSDAAGRYQFLSSTYNELGMPDFSPRSQELAARALIKRRGIDPDVDYSAPDLFPTMTDKLAPEWASFPYQGVSPGGFGRGSSYYGQGGKSVDELRPFYMKALEFHRSTTPQHGGQII